MKKYSEYIDWLPHLIVPDQPVVDLESYMSSLEKKQVAIEKMVGKLSGANDDNAQKLSGCMRASSEAHHASNLCIYNYIVYTIQSLSCLYIHKSIKNVMY